MRCCFAGVLSATGLAAVGERLSQPREDGATNADSPLKAKPAPEAASTAALEKVIGQKVDPAVKGETAVPNPAPPVLEKKGGAASSEGLEAGSAQTAAVPPSEEPLKGGETEMVKETHPVKAASTEPTLASEVPSDTPAPVPDQGSEPKLVDRAELTEKEDVTEPASEPHPESLDSAPAPGSAAPVLHKARSYDKPWLSHSVLPASRSPNEGAPAGEANGPAKADSGGKDERRASEGRARRDSMASYKERRQAKMKEQEERIRGEHEAKLKVKN